MSEAEKRFEWRMLAPVRTDKLSMLLPAYIAYTAYSLKMPEHLLPRLRKRHKFDENVGEKVLVESEGLIYPSFSHAVYLKEYTVEFTSPREDETYEGAVVEALAVAPSPVAGRVWARVRAEVEFASPVRATSDAAWEAALHAASRELSKRVYTGFRRLGWLERVGKRVVVIVRRLWDGELLMFPGRITVYECREHGVSFVGMLGALYHYADEHLGSGELRGLLEWRNRLVERYFGRLAGRVSILNVYRGTVDWYAGEGEGRGGYRVLRAWHPGYGLSVKLVDTGRGLMLRVTLPQQRPARLVLHDPVFSPLLLRVIAEGRPDTYRSIKRRTLAEAEKRGVRERFEALFDAVEGVYMYARVAPRDLYVVNVDAYRSVLEAVEAAGRVLVDVAPRLTVV